MEQSVAMPAWRAQLARIVDSRTAQRVVIAVIVANALVLGLETSPTAMRIAGPAIVAADMAALIFFSAEILAKLAAHGWRFFRSGWNIFDFVVVGIGLLPAGEGLSVVRSLRILRALRLMSVVPSMRRVVLCQMSKRMKPFSCRLFSTSGLISASVSASRAGGTSTWVMA